MNNPKFNGNTARDITSIEPEESTNYQISANSENQNDNQKNICKTCGQTIKNEEEMCKRCQDNKQSEIKKMSNTSRQDEFTYQMRRGGPALLFNHEIYENDHVDKRKGTKYDAQSLINIFKGRNLNLKLHQDFTYKQIMEEIKRVAEEDHTDNDCLVVIVLTHGELTKKGEDLIISYDNIRYPPSQLWLPFSDERCPSLAGKPKVFIIQACRGSDANEGIDISRSSSNAVSTSNTPSTDNSDLYLIPKDTDAKRPVFNMPDLLVARSTFIGYTAFRYEDSGAIYIEHLAQLMKDGNLIDIISLLTKVNFNVSRTEIKEKDKTLLQIPCFTSSLTKKLYF